MQEWSGGVRVTSKLGVERERNRREINCGHIQ
jgi:hypothetical protein